MRQSSKALVLLIALLSLCGIVDTARPQEAVKDETDTRLKIRIHLSLGKTTVAKTAAALSAQTGLTITAADYLKQRTLMVQLDNLSAGAALAALAELNDWAWYETTPNHILLTRRKLRLPPEPNNIALLVQAAMPADLREYLGIARPEENIRQIVYKPRGLDDRGERCMLGYRMAVEHLLDTLNEDNLTREALPYAKFTGIQRDDLLSLLVYNGINSFGWELKSNHEVYDFDPSNCELSLSQGRLIGVTSITTRKSRTAYNFGFDYSTIYVKPNQ